MNEASSPDAVSADRARTAVALLVVLCAFWGMSFPLMQKTTEAMKRAVLASGVDLGQRQEIVVAATCNAWRYAAATVAYLLLTRRRQGRYTSRDVRAGLIVGAFMGGGMFLQLLGLQYTLPSVSAFLTAVPIFTPVGQGLLFRRRLTGRTMLAIAIAVGGIAVFTQAAGAGASQGTLARPSPFPLMGELLTVASAMFFAGVILGIDRFSDVQTPRLTAGMFLVTAAVNLAAVGPMAWPLYSPRVLLALFLDPEFFWPMMVLVLVCSSLAIHLMNAYQPLISPAMASVVYCLEPVFATAFSLLLGMEKWVPMTGLGGAIIIAAVLIIASGAAAEARAERQPL